MARKWFQPGTMTAPLPPALVTVGEGEEANVLTVAWTGILSTKPPRTYISVRPGRHSHGLLMRYGEFVLHMPEDRMVRTVDYVGIFTGKKVKKLQKCALTTVPSQAVGAPTLADCPIALECRVLAVHHSGTHDVFVADIVSISCDERLLDAEGKIHVERAHLLAYAHGEYYTLGKRVGKFGFSATKKKKPRTTGPRAGAKPAPPAGEEKK